MPHHHHHHRRRHDVYDDTDHNQQAFDPSNEVTVHRRQSDRSSRRHPHHDHHESHALVVDPFHDMNSMWRASERDMDSFFGPGFGRFGGGMFGSMRNMMTSMDRMFDDIAANAGPESGGTYFYESRKMTVGPDGRIQEETVRTVPDAHGNPQTSRTIRDGDRVEEMGPYQGRIQSAPPSSRNDDVVVEEVDEYGNPIQEDRVARRSSRGERGRRRLSDHELHRVGDRDRYRRGDRDRRRDEREQGTGGWLRNKYREWRHGA